MAEYYNIFSTKLNGATIGKSLKEGSTDMSSALDSTTKSLLQSSLSDKEVSDPNGYGYIASLPEMRNQDAIDIQAQQNNLFALGAITGVSVIVFGILITSYSNGTK